MVYSVFKKSSILSHKNTAVRAVIFCLWFDEQGMCDKCITSWASLFLLFIGEEWAPGVAGAEAKKVLLEKYRIVFWRKRPIQNASTADTLEQNSYCSRCVRMHHHALCFSVKHTSHCHALCFTVKHTSPCTVLLSNIHYITMPCFTVKHILHHHALFCYPTYIMMQFYCQPNISSPCTVLALNIHNHIPPNTHPP